MVAFGPRNLKEVTRGGGGGYSAMRFRSVIIAQITERRNIAISIPARKVYLCSILLNEVAPNLPQEGGRAIPRIKSATGGSMPPSQGPSNNPYPMPNQPNSSY